MSSDQLLEFVAQLRASIGDHPLGTFLAVLVVLWAIARVTRERVRMPPGLALAMAIGAIAVYVAIVVWYASTASYYDFAEPTVASVGWLFHRGLPIYHAIDAAERYSHMYGPLAFVIPGEFMAMVGPSIAASKAVGALAGLISVAAVYALLRSTRAGRRDVIIWTGLFAVLCLMDRNVSFWIRPDSFSLLFAALSLLAAVALERRWLAAIGVGLCAGVLMNLKLTGALYALPAFGLLVARFGVVPAIVAAATMMGAAVVPFVAFGNVSIDNYVVWVRTSARNGLVFSILRHNVEWAIFLLLPIIPRLRTARWLIGGLLIGVAGVAIAASKPGAGPYHLLPFWPAILFVVAQHRWEGVSRAAFVIAAVLVSSLQQIYFVAITSSTNGAEAAADLARFIDAHPNRSIAMGYANYGERSTFVRPLLVFRNNPYPIDAPAVQEFEMSGLDLPPATIEALRRCAVDIWLMPKDAKPFDGPNKYPSMEYAPLFPESFKHAFVEAYEHERADDTRDFDVWRCRYASAPAPATAKSIDRPSRPAAVDRPGAATSE
jgi:hypothetical protein